MLAACSNASVQTHLRMQLWSRVLALVQGNILVLSIVRALVLVPGRALMGSRNFGPRFPNGLTLGGFPSLSPLTPGGVPTFRGRSLGYGGDLGAG